MLNTINLKKLTAKTLIGMLMVGGFVAQSSNKQTEASIPRDNVQGLELRYVNSAFQCSTGGAQANIKVYVYDGYNNLLRIMSKGDTFTTSNIDSLEELKFRYQFDNVNCIGNRYKYTPNITSYSSGNDRITSNNWNNKYNVAFATEPLGKNDQIPTLGTYGNQASIETMLAGIDSYEELFLVELGTNSTSSGSYDLQDVVLVVDHNPESLTPEPEPEPEPEVPDNGDFDKNGILDRNETEGDFDNNGVPDFQDPDDHGDGIPDVMELYSLSDLNFNDVNDVTYKLNSSTAATVVSLPKAPRNILPTDAVNSYTSTNADYQNPDSDGDTISDLDEAGDNDLTTPPVNTDSSFQNGDNDPDYLDLDSDGDTISDSDEAGDSDSATSPSDKDGDREPNYLDLDSDGDTISDRDEAGDSDLATSPVNTDSNFQNGDNDPDYLDLDSDNDTISDSDEAGDSDLNTSPVNSDQSISGDSIADFRDLDSDDNGIIDDREVNSDVDGDYIKNFQDLDDDGDGIIDVIEIGSNPNSPTNSDRANDGADYQDTDSDNDSIPDEDEGIKATANYTTSVSVTYPNSDGTATSYNLQDFDVSDTKKDRISCASEGTTNTCTVTSESIGNGKVRITGTMTGLDYQVPNYAD